MATKPVVTKRSLKDYASQLQGHHNGKCWTCSIPERQEIDEALLSGVGPRCIVRWLVNEREYKPRERVAPRLWSGDVSEGRIESHKEHCLRSGK